MALFQSSLLLLLIVALFGPAGQIVRPANALQGMRMAPPPVRRVEHIDMNARMIKKRAPVLKRQSAAVTTTDPAANPTPTIPPPSNTVATDAPNTTQDNNGPNTTTCGILDLGCLLGGGGDPNTTTQRTQTSTSDTKTSTSARASSTSSTTSAASQISAPSRSINTRTTIATVTDSASPSQSDQSKDQSASFLSRPVIIGLIVTASCVVAGAAIWTIVRKWKFGASRHFEDRLEPISWEPTQASGLPHDPTVAALARGTGTNKGRNGSIGSNEDHGAAGRNMTAVQDQPVSMAPDFPPPHDFTAGPAGGYHGGYVDMQRGPSPNPTYGRYDAPNPYDAYDYNAGYGQQRRY